MFARVSLVLLATSSIIACAKPATPTKGTADRPAKPPARPTKTQTAAKLSAKRNARLPAARLPGAQRPASDLPPPIVGVIPPYKRAALALTHKGVISQLRKAHYDAERLGLRELAFSVTFFAKKTETKVTAKGHWKSGSPPQITISGVWRKGKPLSDDKRRENILKALTYRMRRLLDGIGNGFLARRLYDWKRLYEGKKRAMKVLADKAGRKLVFRVENEFNKEQVTVDVAATQAITRVTRRSDKGVIRAMDYRYRFVDGRNLVSSGKVSVTFADNAQIKGKMRRALTRIDGMSYQLTYKKIGRFFLPVQIYKNSPKLKDEISLDIAYTHAKP